MNLQYALILDFVIHFVYLLSASYIHKVNMNEVNMNEVNITRR